MHQTEAIIYGRTGFSPHVRHVHERLMELALACVEHDIGELSAALGDAGYAA